jgi:hypothetical protein
MQSTPIIQIQTKTGLETVSLHPVLFDTFVQCFFDREQAMDELCMHFAGTTETRGYLSDLLESYMGGYIKAELRFALRNK